MISISDYLERRSNARVSERLLFSEDGLTLATSVGLALSSQTISEGIGEFKDWESDFASKFNDSMSKFLDRRLNDFNNYQMQDYDAGLIEDEDAIKYFNNIRNNDVEFRWEMETFFAREGGEGAKQVLGYNDYINGESVYVLYSEEQLAQIREGAEKIIVDGKTIIGHHITSVSAKLSSVADNLSKDEFLSVFNGNNIKLMTHGAHLYDSKHGHGGAWQNPTSGDASELDIRKEKIVGENLNITEEKIAVVNLHTGVGIAVAVGLITSIIETAKLKDDPRPWKKKASIVLVSSITRGLEAGILSLLALKTRSEILMLGTKDETRIAVEYVNSVFSEALPGDFSANLDVDSLLTYGGFSVSIAELRIIRSAISAIALWKNSNSEIACKQFGSELKVIIAEEAVFFSIAFVLDALVEIGTDVAMPDPTGGWIIGIRAFWSVSKKGYHIYKNKETQENCKKVRLDGLYEVAITSLVYFG